MEFKQVSDVESEMIKEFRLKIGRITYKLVELTDLSVFSYKYVCIKVDNSELHEHYMKFLVEQDITITEKGSSITINRKIARTIDTVDIGRPDYWERNYDVSLDRISELVNIVYGYNEISVYVKDRFFRKCTWAIDSMEDINAQVDVELEAEVLLMYEYKQLENAIVHVVNVPDEASKFNFFFLKEQKRLAKCLSPKIGREDIAFDTKTTSTILNQFDYGLSDLWVCQYDDYYYWGGENREEFKAEINLSDAVTKIENNRINHIDTISIPKVNVRLLLLEDRSVKMEVIDEAYGNSVVVERLDW